jgi:quinohemoprotein ethanol dehydrogenase
VNTCQFASSYSDKYVVFGASHSAGINFPRMSYNPLTNNLQVCANNTMIAYANTAPNDWHQLSISADLNSAIGVVSAVNMSSNTMSWQNTWPTSIGRCYSGTMPTAGGLVFAAARGDSTRGGVGTLPVGAAPWGGTLYAFDAKTGSKLWSWQAPDYIQAPPITYSVNGKQYVAIYAMGPVPTSPNGTGKRDLLTVFSL